MVASLIPPSVNQVPWWQPWYRFATLCSLVLTVGWLADPTSGRAQTVSQQPDQGTLSLRLPGGKVVPGEGKTVLTHDVAGQQTVGRLHVTAGDQALVMLADGQLVVRQVAEVTPTDRPFQPLSADQVAEQIINQRLAGFRTLQTRRYVCVYNTSEEFALATSRILETMFPGVNTFVQRLGIETHEPEVPLLVIMFKNEREFQQFQPMPGGILAYYNALTNWVVMYEQTQLAGVSPALAVQQSVSTMAHEGVHQILHNIGVQQRLSQWPMWLSEGLAEYFAPTSTGKRWKWKGVGQVNDLRMFELEQYVKDQAFTGMPGQMVLDTAGAARLTSTGYATAWGMVSYLVKTEREKFGELLVDASCIGPLQGSTKVEPNGVINENLAMFERRFGNDYVGIERKLLQYLNHLPYQDPFAEFPHFVVLITQNNGRRPVKDARTFHTQELAAKWRRELFENLAPDKRNETQSSIRQFANRLEAERFARFWLSQ